MQFPMQTTQFVPNTITVEILLRINKIFSNIHFARLTALPNIFQISLPPRYPTPDRIRLNIHPLIIITPQNKRKNSDSIFILKPPGYISTMLYKSNIVKLSFYGVCCFNKEINSPWYILSTAVDLILRTW